jgi:hypothetical protein
VEVMSNPMHPAEVMATLRRLSNYQQVEADKWKLKAIQCQSHPLEAEGCKWWESQHLTTGAELSTVADLIESLAASLEREESGHLATIDQRDAHEERINQIAGALGLDEEGMTWSSNSDVAVNCIEAIECLTAERDALAGMVQEWRDKAELLDKLAACDGLSYRDVATQFDWSLEHFGWYRYTDPADNQVKLARAAKEAENALCSDCPPKGWPTDLTRCSGCPQRKEAANAK